MRNEEMLTLREAIAEVLEQESLDLREISKRFHIKEKEALDHLEHIARSARPKRFMIEPAACLDCGFVFKKRDRLSTPGKCPLCRSLSISPPRFKIIDERKKSPTEKVFFEKLPLTREIPGAKRWEEEKGEFVQVAYQEEMRHLAVFEIRKGFSRGNHYHEKKEEIFYIFDGKIRAIFMDMNTLEKEEKILEKGDRLRLKPRCGHIFLATEDTLVVEYSPQVFDPEDNYKINLG
jgi:predicted Zn-ribbon and HTH transcriptional regulator/quercetin dioxygenase-like cupin family protein